MKKAILIDIGSTNWKLLRKQKETIVKLIHADNLLMGKETESLEGILHLIDNLQDEAAKIVGEAKIFGKL